MNHINNEEALNVISFWTALEVLTYQSFRSPKELAEHNNESLIFSLKDGLPWENGGEKPPLSDRNGNIVKVNPSSAVSSFAWGLPMALKGDLKSLALWSSEEKKVKIVLSTILLKKGECCLIDRHMI